MVRNAARGAGGYRRLARLSGDLVSTSTLNNVGTGRHTGRLRDASIRGIASAVGRPAAEIAGLVGRDLQEALPPFVLPSRAHRLTQPQRRVVLSVVDAILTAADSTGRTGTVSASEPARRRRRR
jgi:hypothetical protein